MKLFSKSVVSFFIIIIGLLTALIILFKKVENDMAMVYVLLIIKGKRTFSSVPKTIKEQVREILIDLELEYLIDEEA